MKLVLIRWDDSSFSHGGWVDEDELKTLNVSRGVSVGFVIEETKDKIVLVQNIGESKQRASAIAIPKSCIKRIWKLKVFPHPPFSA